MWIYLDKQEKMKENDISVKKELDLTVHDINNSIKCDICDGKFTQKAALKGHIASVHGGKKSSKSD